MTSSSRPDLPTVAAIAVIAACLVTFDHEGLGHGGACLALGGHIAQLTSSLFHCSARSGWIDPAGPLTNLAIGTLALLASRRVEATGWRLFLTLVAAFSYFWEGGYAAQAMIMRDGDLYFTGRFLIGAPEFWWRVAGGALGLVLFGVAVRLTSQGLLRLWPAAEARRVARTAWFAATAATLLAALTFSGGIGQDLHDAALEIGGASCPLLILPTGRADGPLAPLPCNGWLIAAALIVLAVFTATLGRGLGAH